MRRLSIVLSIALTIASVTLGSITILATDMPTDEAGTGGALLEALSRVPLATAAREAPLSYLDQAALVAARPGAAQPGSLAEALTAVEAGDPAARLWLAALMGASSGDMGLLRGLPQATGWPEALGFDLLDVERHLSFGTPPADGSVLLGSFDPGAVADAFATRDYTAQGSGAHTLLCGAAGCESGMDVDITTADRSLPFGSEIGRREPLAVSKDAILSSADLPTLESMMAAADGEAASLAEDGAYRALALAGDPGVTLTQATFLPGGMLGLGPDIYRLLGLSPEEAAALITELGDSLEPMPVADAVAILDGATDTEQVVTIGLAFADEADAAIAAEVLPRRLSGRSGAHLRCLARHAAGRPRRDLGDRVRRAGWGGDPARGAHRGAGAPCRCHAGPGDGCPGAVERPLPPLRRPGDAPRPALAGARPAPGVSAGRHRP